MMDAEGNWPSLEGRVVLRCWEALVGSCKSRALRPGLCGGTERVGGRSRSGLSLRKEQPEKREGAQGEPELVDTKRRVMSEEGQSAGEMAT
jgi:hypothetical protein